MRSWVLMSPRLGLAVERCMASARRPIVGGKASRSRAASPSQMGRFETQWLLAPKNLAVLADLSGQWIDLVQGRRPPRGIVLDVDRELESAPCPMQ